MPPVVLWALGAIGAAFAAKWIVKERRRINDELDAVKRQSAPGGKRRDLERDPDTGVYRTRGDQS